MAVIASPTVPTVCIAKMAEFQTRVVFQPHHILTPFLHRTFRKSRQRVAQQEYQPLDSYRPSALLLISDAKMAEFQTRAVSQPHHILTPFSHWMPENKSATHRSTRILTTWQILPLPDTCYFQCQYDGISNPYAVFQPHHFWRAFFTEYLRKCRPHFV